jgi:hypothetical protein
MKKRLVIVAITLLAALMLSPGGGPMRAAGHEIHYTIYYICTCSPCPTGEVVGEWDVDCDGIWSGWGYYPYADTHCTDTVRDVGAPCGPPLP